MFDPLLPDIIKEAIAIISEIVKNLNKRGLAKLEENAKSKSPRIKLITSETEDSIKYHLEFVNSWAKEIGFRGLPTPKDTSKVHIKLDFFLTPRKLQLEKESPQTNLDKILSDKLKHIIILGQPGAGKTTSMKYLSQQILNKKTKSQFKLPVVIKLRELSNKLVKFKGGEIIATIHILEKLLEITGIQIYSKDSTPEIDDYKIIDTKEFEDNLPLIKKILVPFIDKLEALIILDGLDEVTITSKERIIEQVRELTLILKKSKIVLTSRTGDFNYYIDNAIEYEISPLSEKQIQDFSEKWLASKEESKKFYEQIANSPFADTAIRPLTLAHLCTIFERYKKIPEKPKTIYRKIVNLLIEEWDVQKSVQRISKYSQFETDRKFEFLCHLSYYLTVKYQATVFSHNDFVNAYKNICENFNLPAGEANSVAEELESHTGLLFKSLYEKFEFAHKSIQEYLAAEHLVKLPSIPYSPVVLIIPNEIAIALTISSTPTIYFSTLVFENLKRYDVSQVFIDTFLSRILIEKPDFSSHPLWAITFLKLFTQSFHRSLNVHLFDTLAELENSRIALKELEKYYKINSSPFEGVVELVEFNYLDNEVFSETPKRLLSKRTYLHGWQTKLHQLDETLNTPSTTSPPASC